MRILKEMYMTSFRLTNLPNSLTSPGPAWSLVYLVQAAISCGATYLRIEQTGDQVCLEWDGRPLRDPEKLLEDKRACAGRLEELLALGIVRMAQGRPSTVIYEGWNGDKGLQWRLTANGAKCKTLGPAGSRPVHMVKRTPRKRWHNLFASSPGLDSTEEELRTVRDVCRFAPLQLNLNGEVISHSVGLGPGLTVVIIQPANGERHFPLDEQTGRGAIFLSTELPYTAALTVGGQNPGLAALNLLKDGLLYQLEEPRLASLGLRCILACEDLECLGHEGLARDQFFDAVLSDLTSRCLVLGKELSRHYQQMSALERVEAVIQIKCYAELYARRGEISEAIDCFQRLLECQLKQAGENSLEASETLVNLGDLHFAAGRLSAARHDYHRSLALSGEARRDSLALMGLARLELAEGDSVAAEDLASRALAERRTHSDAFDSRIAEACRLLARVYTGTPEATPDRLRQTDQLLLEALRILEHTQGSQHPEVAEVLLELASHRQQQFRYRECEPLLKRALQIRQQCLGEDRLEVAEILDLLGDLYEEQGRPGAAGKAYGQALALWEIHHPPGHPQIQERLSKLAILFRLHGKFGLAEPLYRRLLLQAASGKSDPLESADRYCDVAMLAWAQGNHDQAQQAFEFALDLWRQDFSAQGNYAWTLDRLGELLSACGKFREALSRLSLARSIWLRLLGKGHPDLCVNLELQARAWCGLRQWGQAERFLRRALHLKERFLGPDHRVCIRLLGSLAQVLRAAQKRQQALRIYRQVCIRRLRSSTSVHLPPADRLCGRYGLSEVSAWSYLARSTDQGLQGRFRELRPLCLAALQAREKALGPGHADVAYLLDDLANLYRAQRRPEAALGLYQRSLAIRRDWLGTAHPDVCLSLAYLLDLYSQRQRWDLAQAMAEELLKVLEANLGSPHPEIQAVLLKRAEIYRRAGAEERSQECSRQVEELTRRSLQVEEMELAIHFAELAAARGDLESAASYYDRAIHLRVGPSGAEGVQMIQVYRDCASVLRKLEREEQAVVLETESEILQSLQSA